VAIEARRAPEVRESLGLGVLRVPLIAAAVLAVGYLASSALVWRSDGAFHAGVVHAVSRAWPPEDPFLAGLPLRYFWGWHAWAASALALAPSVPVTAWIATSSALALAAALMGVRALARALGGEDRARGWATFLLLAGAAPFAWVVLAGHALVGETRGLGELEPVLAHGGDLAMRALDPGFLHPSLVLPLDKFVVVTPFAWGLAGASLLFLMLRDALVPGAGSARIGVGLALAAIMFVHPAAGALLAVASGAGVCMLLLAGRVTRREAGLALLALGVGALACLPYRTALAPSGDGGATALGLGLDPRSLLSVLWGERCSCRVRRSRCADTANRSPHSSGPRSSC
jgi:hypothetical protein